MGSQCGGSTAGSCRRRSGWGPAFTTASTPRRPAPATCPSWAIREIWPLDEQDQDAELTRRAIAFAREQPGRVLEPGHRQAGTLLEPLAQCRGVALAGGDLRQCGRGAPALRAHGCGPLGPPPRPAGLGAARRARCSISVRCTWSSPARCGIASPARCPRWAWRRSDGRRSGDGWRLVLGGS